MVKFCSRNFVLPIAFGLALISCGSLKSAVNHSLHGVAKEVHPINGERTLVVGNCQRGNALFSKPESDSEICQSTRNYHCDGASVVRSVEFDRNGSYPVVVNGKVTRYVKYKLYNVVFTCTGQPSSLLSNSS